MKLNQKRDFFAVSVRSVPVCAQTRIKSNMRGRRWNSLAREELTREMESGHLPGDLLHLMRSHRAIPKLRPIITHSQEPATLTKIN